MRHAPGNVHYTTAACSAQRATQNTSSTIGARHASSTTAKAAGAHICWAAGPQSPQQPHVVASSPLLRFNHAGAQLRVPLAQALVRRACANSARDPVPVNSIPLCARLARSLASGRGVCARIVASCFTACFSEDALHSRLTIMGRVHRHGLLRDCVATYAAAQKARRSRSHRSHHDMDLRCANKQSCIAMHCKCQRPHRRVTRARAAPGPLPC